MKENKAQGYYIFRAWIRHPKTGKRLYAKNYGKKAFKIWLKG